MKKIIVMLTAIVVLMNFPLDSFGQKDAKEDPIPKIFDKYEEKEGVESITISPALLGLMKNGKTSDKKTQELISKISGLRILTLTDISSEKGKSTKEALTNELQPAIKKGYEEIMKVKSSGERLELYVRDVTNCKDCKGLSALLFITSGSSSTTIMHLSGTIDKTLIDAVMNGEIGTSSGK
ncbi:MAG: DUF4252 domain-containing protein [Bacteroidales bacterium]|jgi:hypothetical protein|nr:DUF4252 domain-containing protein [Bacteroidales bacterium]